MATKADAAEKITLTLAVMMDMELREDAPTSTAVSKVTIHLEHAFLTGAWTWTPHVPKFLDSTLLYVQMTQMFVVCKETTPKTDATVTTVA